MKKEHIKDFFSLQTFEILYINPIKSFVSFAVKFKGYLKSSMDLLIASICLLMLAAF